MFNFIQKIDAKHTGILQQVFYSELRESKFLHNCNQPEKYGESAASIDTQCQD